MHAYGERKKSNNNSMVNLFVLFIFNNLNRKHLFKKS